MLIEYRLETATTKLNDLDISDDRFQEIKAKFEKDF